MGIPADRENEIQSKNEQPCFNGLLAQAAQALHQTKYHHTAVPIFTGNCATWYWATRSRNYLLSTLFVQRICVPWMSVPTTGCIRIMHPNDFPGVMRSSRSPILSGFFPELFPPRKRSFPGGSVEYRRDGCNAHAVVRSRLQHHRFQQHPGRKRDESDGIESFEVKTNRLDDFQFKNVGFLKVDVEGHELEVLQGAVETITSSKPASMWRSKNATGPALFIVSYRCSSSWVTIAFSCSTRNSFPFSSVRSTTKSGCERTKRVREKFHLFSP